MNFCIFRINFTRKSCYNDCSTGGNICQEKKACDLKSQVHFCHKRRHFATFTNLYIFGYSKDGKTKYHSVYAKSYQEVKEKLLKCKADKQQFQSSGKLTVKELFEEWLCSVKLRVKASTYANYRMKANKHILPEFGGLRYENLTAKHLHSFMQKKLDSGLSAKYVSDIVIVFKTMTKYVGRVHGFKNPIADVILPKPEKKEMQLFTKYQQKRLTHYLLQHQDNTSIGILISLYMGLRVGEVCGLKWSDIDFEKSILTVRRTVQRILTENGTIISIDTPKTNSSCRCIPIPDFLLKLLENFRSQDELLYFVWFKSSH